jgi:hypothetical protein
VTIGEPTVWSLEQAHYLLKRMHSVDDGLKTHMPSETELDANALNGSRIEILQTLFGAALEFDQPKGVKNQAAVQIFEDSLGRRQELRARLDQRRTQLADAFARITELQVQRTAMTSDPNATDQDRARTDAAIAAAQAEKDALQAEITSLNTELTSVSVAAPDISGPSATLPTSGPSLAGAKDLIAKALDGTGIGPGSPKLHVSTILDNYVQMQYEIIVKQLTLLRDEVGPEQRIVFLELPVSIYSEPRRSNRRLVQTRWQLGDVCICGDKELKKRLQSLRSKHPNETRSETTENTETESPQRPIESAELDEEFQQRALKFSELKEICTAGLWKDNKVTANNRSIRTVDLVPRQSALNVNQLYDRTYGISAGLKAIWFGVGAAAQFQRQRQLFEQFVHQDTFASGFGKGESEFGWTFGPLPGTRQIAPGVRTTYAVLSLPKDAIAFKLRGEALSFNRRRAPQEGESIGGRDFVIQLPEAQESFFVTNVDYTPVQPGKRVTVFLEGENFSPQIGVLVNGVPLKRSVAITRPAFATGEEVPASTAITNQQIEGEYELVNSGKLIVTFSAGSSYEGTPIIALVTPQKTTPINFFRDLVINRRKYKTSLARQSRLEPMFLQPLAVNGIEFTNLPGPTRRCNNYRPIEVVGRGFRPWVEFWINEKKAQIVDPVSTSRCRLCDLNLVDNSSEVKVTVRQSTRQGQEEVAGRFPNPRAPRVLRQEILRVSQDGKTFDLKLGISKGTASSALDIYRLGSPTPVLLKAEQLSSTELLLEGLPTAENPLVLKLTDPNPDLSTVVSVAIPKPPAIRSIEGPDGTASGLTTGNYPVTIRGQELRNVTRVFFGNSLATIQSARNSEILVTAPPGANKVPVRLETDILFLGRELDNGADFGDPSGKAFFTYVKPPEKKPGT